MFSKVANVIKLRSLSLANKLMLLNSISTFSMLGVVCVFLYPTIISIIHQIHDSHFAIFCIKKIAIALLFFSVGTLILSNLVARNGLRRINEFAKKMEAITANSLDERINANDWPQELMALGETFNHMLNRIHHSFIRHSQFSSDIAHELRNPINNLKGLSELALTKDLSVAEYRKTLESHMEEYDYLAKLIENLLFLARSDNGKIPLSKKSLSARELIIHTCDYYQAIADERNITFVVEDDAMISVDPMLFKRVIHNVISNAVRYTKDNEKITITMASLNKSHAQITVTDTGIGIDQTHLSHLFDRFYRVDPSRSSQSGGVGLGLSIVKSIMDLHQGEVVIESQLGVGTSVRLRVPATSSPLPSAFLGRGIG